MSHLDVSVTVDIAAAPADVAAVMFDPAREPEWMAAITGVEVLDPALAPGARVRHRARFLGRDVSWITQVEAVHFPHLLKLNIAEGPFSGSVTYQVQRSAGGATASIRNVGETESFKFLPTAMVAGPMRSALTADLERLKVLVEQSVAAPSGPA